MFISTPDRLREISTPIITPDDNLSTLIWLGMDYLGILIAIPFAIVDRGGLVQPELHGGEGMEFS